MTNDMTFNVNLRIGNKKGFLADIKRSVENVSIGGAAATTKSGTGGGFLAGALKGLGGTMTKLLGWVAAIGTAVSGLLGPIISIASQILKMLGEFLRPIADMVIVLLMPILLVLRPIVNIARGMMAPFRAAAYQLAAAGSKEFSKGNYLKGGLLFGLAFSTLTIGFQRMLWGMIGETLKLLVDLSAWIQKTIAGVLFDIAIKIATILDKILPIDLSGVSQLLKDARDLVLGTEKTKGLIDENADKAKKAIDDVTNWISGGALAAIEKAAGELGVTIDLHKTAANNLKEAGDSIKDHVKGLDDEGIPACFEVTQPFEKKTPYLHYGSKGAPTSVNKGFLSPLSGVGVTGLSIAQVMSGGDEKKFQEIINNMSSGWLRGLTTMHEDTMSYMGGSYIPDAFRTGLDTMTADITTFTTTNKQSFAKWIGPEGTIPTIMQEGFSEMRSNSDSFAKAMKRAANEVKEAVNTALSAASKAKSAKEKYERELKKYKSKRSD